MDNTPTTAGRPRASTTSSFSSPWAGRPAVNSRDDRSWIPARGLGLPNIPADILGLAGFLRVTLVNRQCLRKAVVGPTHVDPAERHRSRIHGGQWQQGQESIRKSRSGCPRRMAEKGQFPNCSSRDTVNLKVDLRRSAARSSGSGSCSPRPIAIRGPDSTVPSARVCGAVG
jgi:hypothetical protein